MHILEVAGKVFAEQGYESATSKEICIQANTNQAAVNYHFGSRDELYIAVLVEAHRRFISLDILSEIAGERMSAQDKLAYAIDTIIDNIADKGWHLRVFMREILFPSPLLKVLLANEVMPKLNLLKQWLSEIIGIELDSPVLAHCFLSTFFTLYFVANSKSEYG